MVNFDETAVQNLCNADRFWSKKGKPKTRLVGKQVERLTIMTAIDSVGRLFVKIRRENANRWTTIDAVGELLRAVRENDEDNGETT